MWKDNKKEPTLCWNCTGGPHCPWENGFEPVPGWKATPTKVNFGKRQEDSYIVHECPLFRQNNYGKKLVEKKVFKNLVDSETTCPQCGGHVITLATRCFEEYKYRRKECVKCHFRFSTAQLKDDNKEYIISIVKKRGVKHCYVQGKQLRKKK